MEESKERENVYMAERAVDRAFSTGKADRAAITHQAQLDAADAVAMVGIAMESDEEADEAAKLSIIASGMGNREKAKNARNKAREAQLKAVEDHRAATKSAKQAYDAIKFSDPSKLGFMRVVQIAFLAHIVGTIVALILTSRDTISYNSVTFVDWITVTLEAVAFYFFWNRYKLGRPLVIGIAAINIAAHIITDLATSQFSLGNFCIENAFNIFLLLYFLFSDRVKAVLVNDLSTDKGAEEDFVIERSGWPFFRNLIIYFVVFSVLGHWMEAAFCQLIRLGIVQGEYHPENTMLWRDWFYPYPMHGTAVILIAVILYPLYTWTKDKFSNRFAPYAVCFLINMLVCTLIEFFGGLMFNANLQNWDYSNLPFNFMGQVCLQNAIGFGIASSVIAWWLYPTMERAIARVRPAVMNIVCVIVAIVGGILFSLYAVSPPEGIGLSSTDTSPQIELDKERQDIYSTTKLNMAALDATQQQLDDSHLPDNERIELQKHIDAIKNEYEQLENSLKNPPEAGAAAAPADTSAPAPAPAPEPNPQAEVQATDEAPAEEPVSEEEPLAEVSYDISQEQPSDEY